MNTLTVCSFRGKLIETKHEVAVAIQDCDGGLQAGCGDPELIVYVRSAAKTLPGNGRAGLQEYPDRARIPPSSLKKKKKLQQLAI